MRRIATVFITLLLAVAVFDIATGLEHWPFGSYPMYSLIYSKNLTWLRLYGVDSSGEFPLRGDRAFAPFDEARLVSALVRMRPSELPEAVLNLLKLHNRNSHPPVRTLRLYSVRWILHPGLQGNEPPDQRELLAEVSSFER